MAIFRVRHDKDYTVMSNHHLRDPALSLKAKGLLSQMLALPDDWDYSVAGLATCNEYRGAAATASWRTLSTMFMNSRWAKIRQRITR